MANLFGHVASAAAAVLAVDGAHNAGQQTDDIMATVLKCDRRLKRTLTASPLSVNSLLAEIDNYIYHLNEIPECHPNVERKRVAFLIVAMADVFSQLYRRFDTMKESLQSRMKQLLDLYVLFELTGVATSDNSKCVANKILTRLTAFVQYTACSSVLEMLLNLDKGWTAQDCSAVLRRNILLLIYEKVLNKEDMDRSVNVSDRQFVIKAVIFKTWYELNKSDESHVRNVIDKFKRNVRVNQTICSNSLYSGLMPAFSADIPNDYLKLLSSAYDYQSLILKVFPPSISIKPRETNHFECMEIDLTDEPDNAANTLRATSATSDMTFLFADLPYLVDPLTRRCASADAADDDVIVLDDDDEDEDDVQIIETHMEVIDVENCTVFARRMTTERKPVIGACDRNLPAESGDIEALASVIGNVSLSIGQASQAAEPSAPELAPAIDCIAEEDSNPAAQRTESVQTEMSLDVAASAVSNVSASTEIVNSQTSATVADTQSTPASTTEHAESNTNAPQRTVDDLNSIVSAEVALSASTLPTDKTQIVDDNPSHLSSDAETIIHSTLSASTTMPNVNKITDTEKSVDELQTIIDPLPSLLESCAEIMNANSSALNRPGHNEKPTVSADSDAALKSPTILPNEFITFEASVDQAQMNAVAPPSIMETDEENTDDVTADKVEKTANDEQLTLSAPAASAEDVSADQAEQMDVSSDEIDLDRSQLALSTDTATVKNTALASLSASYLCVLPSSLNVSNETDIDDALSAIQPTLHGENLNLTVDAVIDTSGNCIDLQSSNIVTVVNNSIDQVNTFADLINDKLDAIQQRVDDQSCIPPTNAISPSTIPTIDGNQDRTSVDPENNEMIMNVDCPAKVTLFADVDVDINKTPATPKSSSADETPASQSTQLPAVESVRVSSTPTSHSLAIRNDSQCTQLTMRTVQSPSQQSPSAPNEHNGDANADQSFVAAANASNILDDVAMPMVDSDIYHSSVVSSLTAFDAVRANNVDEVENEDILSDVVDEIARQEIIEALTGSETVLATNGSDSSAGVTAVFPEILAPELSEALPSLISQQLDEDWSELTDSSLTPSPSTSKNINSTSDASSSVVAYSVKINTAHALSFSDKNLSKSDTEEDALHSGEVSPRLSSVLLDSEFEDPCYFVNDNAQANDPVNVSTQVVFSTGKAPLAAKSLGLPLSKELTLPSAVLGRCSTSNSSGFVLNHGNSSTKPSTSTKPSISCTVPLSSINKEAISIVTPNALRPQLPHASPSTSGKKSSVRFTQFDACVNGFDGPSSNPRYLNDEKFGESLMICGNEAPLAVVAPSTIDAELGESSSSSNSSSSNSSSDSNRQNNPEPATNTAAGRTDAVSDRNADVQRDHNPDSVTARVASISGILKHQPTPTPTATQSTIPSAVVQQPASVPKSAAAAKPPAQRPNRNQPPSDFDRYLTRTVAKKTRYTEDTSDDDTVMDPSYGRPEKAAAGRLRRSKHQSRHRTTAAQTAYATTDDEALPTATTDDECDPLGNTNTAATPPALPSRGRGRPSKAQQKAWDLAQQQLANRQQYSSVTDDEDSRMPAASLTDGDITTDGEYIALGYNTDNDGRQVRHNLRTRKAKSTAKRSPKRSSWQRCEPVSRSQDTEDEGGLPEKHSLRTRLRRVAANTVTNTPKRKTRATRDVESQQQPSLSTYRVETRDFLPIVRLHRLPPITPQMLSCYVLLQHMDATESSDEFEVKHEPKRARLDAAAAENPSAMAPSPKAATTVIAQTLSSIIRPVRIKRNITDRDIFDNTDRKEIFLNPPEQNSPPKPAAKRRATAATEMSTATQPATVKEAVVAVKKKCTKRRRRGKLTMRRHAKRPKLPDFEFVQMHGDTQSSRSSSTDAAAAAAGSSRDSIVVGASTLSTRMQELKITAQHSQSQNSSSSSSSSNDSVTLEDTGADGVAAAIATLETTPAANTSNAEPEDEMIPPDDNDSIATANCPGANEMPTVNESTSSQPAATPDYISTIRYASSSSSARHQPAAAASEARAIDALDPELAASKVDAPGQLLRQPIIVSPAPQAAAAASIQNVDDELSVDLDDIVSPEYEEHIPAALGPPLLVNPVQPAPVQQQHQLFGGTNTSEGRVIFDEYVTSSEEDLFSRQQQHLHRTVPNEVGACSSTESATVSDMNITSTIITGDSPDRTESTHARSSVVIGHHHQATFCDGGSICDHKPCIRSDRDSELGSDQRPECSGIAAAEQSQQSLDDANSNCSSAELGADRQRLVSRTYSNLSTVTNVFVPPDMELILDEPQFVHKYAGDIGAEHS